MAAPVPQLSSLFEDVRELHAACRQWTAHLPQNLPYVDLMFAFGLATLGDRGHAVALVEDARHVMEVAEPAQGSDVKNFETTVSTIVCNFLFKAFKYRVEQALAGNLHGGSLSAKVVEDLEEIERRGRINAHNPWLLADYAIVRTREHSRILEPQDRLDVYGKWTKNSADTLTRELSELHAIREPGELAERIRMLLKDGMPGKRTDEIRFSVFQEVLELAPRVGESFTIELLERVPEVLAGWTSKGESDPRRVPWKQAHLLERALFLAGQLNRGDLVQNVMNVFCTLIHDNPDDFRCKLTNVAAGQCLRSLAKLGMRSQIDQFLTTLQVEVLNGESMLELRQKHDSDTETWAAVLQTQLHLAAGWLVLGQPELADPILTAAERELLDPGATRFLPKDYVDLARAYVRTLGEGPAETGVTRIRELFRTMPSGRITNTLTTAKHYSRFHLCLVDDVVLAICRMGTEPRVVTSA